MKKLLLALALLSALPLASEARYGAYAVSKYSGTIGAYGFTYNYKTKNGAVNAAVNRMPGYSPYSYGWWSHTRYCAFARGYDSSYSSFRYSATRGYRTRSGAVNAAIGNVPSYSRYSLSYHSGYNY